MGGGALSLDYKIKIGRHFSHRFILTCRNHNNNCWQSAGRGILLILYSASVGPGRNEKKQYKNNMYVGREAES